MAKKTIDTSNWIASDTPTPTIDTSNWLPVETPIEQDFNIENVQKRFEQEKIREVQAEKSRELYDTRPEYAGLNKEEKEYLVKKEKEGKLAGEDLASAAWTMAGNDPMQKKVAAKDEKGNKIYSDLGELYKKGEEKGFWSSALTDIELSKYTGGNYYMKDRGDGTLVPVPLAYNEKPEAKNVKDAQVFSSLDDDAYGDSRFVDIAKKAWNIIPAVSQGFISIPETVQGLITGKTAKGYEVAKDVLEAAKFKTSQEFQKGIIDSQNIDEFSDFLSKDVYDLSPDKIINTVVNVASSLGEFAVTRKMIPIKGKAGTFAAGTVMNIKEPLQAAEDAGVEGRAKYAVAATYALAASGLETALGIEGKIFDDAATTAKKQMINKIIKDNVEVVGGKLTKESVENLYKETLKEVPSFYAKYLKNTVGEVTEEVAQNMIQNATQQIHDMVVKDDPEAAKFNTKFLSPEALAEYMNSAFGGLIGGVAGSRFIKDKQSQTAYDAIKDGKENELKVQLVSGLKEGRLTQEDYDRAIFKIDSYKSYYDATKDRNVTDEERRKIFDLTYEKENTKSGIERLKQNNPGGINDELIATKEQQISDYSQQIKDIWAASEARTSEAPVEEAKAQVPQWKTDLDTFSKEKGNADKQVSQNFVTKDKIETAVGASPQLNELSKPFSIDFKAPHLPEDAGNIQIRDGILYEPYLVKQEGKEDVVQTRQLPVYAMEDNNGGTWLFAVGQKTDLDAPDVSYLIKLNEEGAYEGHQEFKYETAKKNELTFDDIVPTFNKLGIKAASLTGEIKGIENIPQAEFEEVEDIEMEAEEAAPIESEQFKNVYEKVKAGVSKAKLKLLPNNTVGVTIDGEDVPFASQRYLFREGLPSGDVEVNLRTVENVEGKYGRGVLVETEDGTPLGYIRRAGKVETGRVAAEKISPTENVDIDVPVELSDVAKERLQQIEKDQENYELVEDELSRRYVNKKTGESYTSVSSFVSGKSGGDFEGKNQLKETAFKVGNIINGIVRDFFNGTIKSYSNYAENISRDDYDDIIRQLQDVIQYAKDKGYSIVTKPLIIADDVNKIAGQPNLLMVDENGKFYVYDVATLRNTKGLETKELLNRRYKNRPTNAERISAQVNILADILNNKYGLEVGRVGVIPFDVDYEVLSKDKPVQITHAVRTKRVDFKRKQILKPTGKTSAAEVKEKVEEIKPEEKPTEKKAEEKPKEPKPAEKEVVQGEELKEIKDPKTGKTIKFYKVTPRQQAINEILSMVSRFHNLKRGRLGRNAEVGRDLRQAIKSAVADFKEKFDDNIILEEQGMNRIEIKNKNRRKYRIVDYSFRNRTPVKDYVPLSERDAKVIELFDLLNEIGITAFPEIKGADGKRMSNKQLSTAISDVVNNVPTNGAKFLLKTLEGYVKDGMVEAEYAGAGQSQFIPLDDWMAALKSVNVDDAIDENAKVEEEIFEQPSDTYLEEGWVDIVREEGDEDYPFQKAKSVKSIFDESVKLFYKIRGAEGAAKKRNLTQERKELLKENTRVRFIDNNISSIFEQLEKQGIIKRKGNCP
jgi:hypothetical protein